jgi:hypothetical protein
MKRAMEISSVIYMAYSKEEASGVDDGRLRLGNLTH